MRPHLTFGPIHIARRLEALLELQAMSEYHAGLAMSLLDACDEALRVDA